MDRYFIKVFENLDLTELQDMVQQWLRGKGNSIKVVSVSISGAFHDGGISMSFKELKPRPTNIATVTYTKEG